MKKTIITISGLPGSGKSSAAKTVAQKLSYEHFSSGDLMRSIALKEGITLNELGKAAEKDKGAIDNKIDQALRDLKDKDGIVIDSRLAFHWIPESFKVFLKLPLEIAKDRIWANLKDNPLRQQSERVSSPEEVLEKTKERIKSEETRYMNLYNVMYNEESNFDLVVDTNENNIEQTVDVILKAYKEWRNQN